MTTVLLLSFHLVLSSYLLLFQLIFFSFHLLFFHIISSFLIFSSSILSPIFFSGSDQLLDILDKYLEPGIQIGVFSRFACSHFAWRWKFSNYGAASFDAHKTSPDSLDFTCFAMAPVERYKRIKYRLAYPLMTVWWAKDHFEPVSFKEKAVFNAQAHEKMYERYILRTRNRFDRPRTDSCISQCSVETLNFSLMD